VTAVPFTTTVSLAVLVAGWVTVTLAVGVESPVPGEVRIRITSLGRMSGVTPCQQPPPGWFTSTMPSNPAVPGSSCGTRFEAVPTTIPLRTTSTVGRSLLA